MEDIKKIEIENIYLQEVLTELLKHSIMIRIKLYTKYLISMNLK